jgi:hypothetical protein
MLLRFGMVLVLALAGAVTSAARAAEAPVVENPKVTTDKSVDCSTVDGILKGIIRDGMSDEEKVLAVFNFVRRVIYHGDGPQAEAYNFFRMINVHGHGSCLRQTTPMWVLLSKLGYKCRGWATGGHHCIQVFYGEKWHLLDPHMNFYVYDRATPKTIASIEQIKADPTLAGDAVKDGRACPGFLLCGDGVDTFATKDGWQDLGDFPEGKKYTPVISEPFGGIALRRGETCLRTWMPGPYWYQKGSPKKGEGPRHGCGGGDRKDVVNWPLYEPHEWQGRFRHWGAGRLEYAPDLKTDHWADAAVSQSNLAGGKDGLAPAEAGKDGEAVFAVNCPYVITAGELKLSQSGEGKVAAAVSRDGGKTWQALELAAADGGKAACLFRDQVDGCFEGYRLKLTIPAKTAVTGLELVSHFQLNPYSLPYLVPGKNTVSVEAGRFGAPLAVTWNWAEGEGWKDAKSVTKTFEKNGTFEIEIAGPKYPRMTSLILQVAP